MFPYWSTHVRLSLLFAASASGAWSQDHWKVSPTVEEPFQPLTVKERVYLFSYRSIEPSAFLKSAFTAGMAQWRDSPAEWGQGMEGYGKRYGHRVLSQGVENAIGLGVALALREDGRYFRRPSGTAWQRIGNALSQTVTTRTVTGGVTFAGWRLAGNYGTQFVSNAWRPESERGAGDTMIRGTISMSFDVVSNVFKEFWPDIKRKVFRK